MPYYEFTSSIAYYPYWQHNVFGCLSASVPACLPPSLPASLLPAQTVIDVAAFAYTHVNTHTDWYIQVYAVFGEHKKRAALKPHEVATSKNKTNELATVQRLYTMRCPILNAYQMFPSASTLNILSTKLQLNNFYHNQDLSKRKVFQ